MPSDLGRNLLARRGLLAGVERLGALGAVTVDGDGLQPQLPRLHVGVRDRLRRGLIRHIHGFANRSRNERLGGGHHLDVAHVVNGAGAVHRAERAVEDGQVFGLEVRRPLDGVVLVNELDDGLALAFGVAQLRQALRDGLVDDLHHAAADQRLVLDDGDVRLDPRRVAVHQEPNCAGRREYCGLCITISMFLPNIIVSSQAVRAAVRSDLGDQALVDGVYVFAVLAA